VVARVRYYLNPDGSIAQPMPMRQILSSWNLLYGSMRRHFPTKHYHSGKHLSDIQHSGEQVTAIFADETRDTADLLIGADGPNSCDNASCRMSTIVMPDMSPIGDWLTKPNWSKMLPLFTERFVFISQLAHSPICDPW